jgi:hypothetical protein
MPANTTVFVLELGKEDTIDNMKANWVKVRLENGTEGWCFGGYLRIPIEASPLPDYVPQKPEEEIAPETGQEVALGQTTVPVEKKPPFYLRFGGIAIVAIAGVVVFLLLRKRR